MTALFNERGWNDTIKAPVAHRDSQYQGGVEITPLYVYSTHDITSQCRKQSTRKISANRMKIHQ